VHGEDIERAVRDACFEELEARGLKKTQASRAERELAAGITGFISLSIDRVGVQSGPPVNLDPFAGVRHEEASRLASIFLGLEPGAHTVPTRSLINLVSTPAPAPRWMVPDWTSIGDVARLLADDVVFHAYPWMQRLASTRALIEELAQPRWGIHAAYVLAVLYMLDGQRVDEAKRVLMRRQLPRTQDPTTWGNNQFARYLDAFSEYFGVDLDVAQWPVREPKKPSDGTVRICDPGVVRAGLKIAGRWELVERVSELSADQMSEIANRGAALFRSRAEPDLRKAFGLAAAELMDAADKRG